MSHFDSSWTTESCVYGFHVYRDSYIAGNLKMVNCSNGSVKQTVLKTGMQCHCEILYKEALPTCKKLQKYSVSKLAWCMVRISLYTYS